MISRALLAVALALALARCGDDREDGGDPRAGSELTVSAAASLKEAFRAYGGEFEAEERFSFAGSDALAAQIRSGAPADVYAAANTSLPDELLADGLVSEPVVFARNELVLAVPSESSIESVGDLAEPERDLVIGAQDVPVGDYAREVLGRLPARERRAILANVRSEEPDVKGVVGKLATGAADAGFVYATDAVAAGEDLTAIRLPAELEPVVAYGVAVVDGGSNPELAEDFVAGLLEGAGARALRDASFLPPADQP